MKLPNENELEWHVVKPNEFKDNLLGNEFKPHDVEIIVTYRNGKVAKGNVKWELIRDLYERHGVSQVQSTYETILELT